MTLTLLKRYDYYAIRNDDADFIVARVYPLNGPRGPCKVSSGIGPSHQQDQIGVVNSL